MSGHELEPQVPRIVAIPAGMYPPQQPNNNLRPTPMRLAQNEQGLQIWVEDTNPPSKPTYPITYIQSSAPASQPLTPPTYSVHVEAPNTSTDVAIPDLDPSQVNRIDTRSALYGDEEDEEQEGMSLLKKRVITAGVLGVMAAGAWFGAPVAGTKAAEATKCWIADLSLGPIKIGGVMDFLSDAKQACGENTTPGENQ